MSFGSDDYFALIAARPEWGRYFALGEHVIVVLDGKAYEARAGEAPALELPEPEEDASNQPGAEEPADSDAPSNVFEAIWQAIVEFVEGILEFFEQ